MVIAILPFATADALAAPFCLIGLGLPPQCIYFDVAQCNKASSPPDIVCIVDPSVTLNMTGGSRYCVVDSFNTAQCLYDDHNACDTAAGRAGAICFDRSTNTSSNNPFRFDQRVPF